MNSGESDFIGLLNCYIAWMAVVAAFFIAAVAAASFLGWYQYNKKIKEAEEKGIEGKAYAYVAMGAAEANMGRFLKAIELFIIAKELFLTINKEDTAKECGEFIKNWEELIIKKT